MIAVGRESIENVIDFSGGPSTKAGVLPLVRENLSVLNTLWIAPKLRQNRFKYSATGEVGAGENSRTELTVTEKKRGDLLGSR